jgi:hypothetical protein
MFTAVSPTSAAPYLKRRPCNRYEQSFRIESSLQGAGSNELCQETGGTGHLNVLNVSHAQMRDHLREATPMMTEPP